MPSERQVNIEQARLHLQSVAQIFAELGQDKAAAKVAKLIEKELPLDRFSDGLYRIEGVPWERMDGEWASTQFRGTETSDADVVARYGEPVPVVEVGSDVAVIDKDKLPSGTALRELLSVASAVIYQYQKLSGLADWLDQNQPVSTRQDLL